MTTAGQITNVYRVDYSITINGYIGGIADVSLTEGYTDFEDIRRIIAMRRNILFTYIRVDRLERLHEPEPHH